MVKVVKKIYLFAAIYGILCLTPQYFMEKQVGIDYPPPITHSEFFYGFVGIALACQFLFLIISRDPIRYRPMMIVSILEKASFGFPCLILYSMGKISLALMVFGSIDLFLMALFIFSYTKTPDALAGQNFSQV